MLSAHAEPGKRERVSETVSKKRGRPEAFDPGWLSRVRALYPEILTHRGQVAKAYEIAAVRSLAEEWQPVEGVQHIFGGAVYRATVLEHLGRLKIENSWDDDEVRQIARLINERLASGERVRGVVELLRRARRECRQLREGAR